MLNASPISCAASAKAPLPRDIHALLLDDSSFDRARIRRMSGNTNLPIHLDEIGSIAELDRAVQQQDYDLILIDYRLPVGDGMVALSMIQANARNRHAGKIMITGNEALGTAVQAMRAGCHDFLSKDSIDADILKKAMLNALALAQHGGMAPVVSNLDHRALLREGLISALQDASVQGSMLSLIQTHLPRPNAEIDRRRTQLEQSDLEALLAELNATDDFIFH